MNRYLFNFMIACCLASCSHPCIKDNNGFILDNQRHFFGFPTVEDCLVGGKKAPILPDECLYSGYLQYVFWDTSTVEEGVFLFEKIVYFKDGKPSFETNQFLKRSYGGTDSFIEVTLNIHLAEQGSYPWVAPQSWGHQRNDMASSMGFLKRWGVHFPAVDRWLDWAQQNNPAQYREFQKPASAFTDIFLILGDSTAARDVGDIFYK